jgi:transcriptional regulator with XRE-family HTH domain
MQFDYSKLLGRIKEIGFTQQTLAKHIGMAESSMCLKLNNKANFKHNEIFLICEALKIEISKIGVYFFTKKVRENEQE